MKEKSVKMVKVAEHNGKWVSGSIFLPSCQSGDRWKDDRRIAYVKSLVSGVPTPAMYLGEDGSLIEGQQRTKAIAMAIDGKLSFSKEQIDVLKECKIRVITLADYTPQEMVNFYIAINNGGVAHNKLEIAKANLSQDDSLGFTELENHPIWQKLPIKQEREGIKKVLMQSLLLIHSEDCSIDIGTASQETVLLALANNIRPYAGSLTKIAQSIDYLDSAICHKQKWMKVGMIPFIISLASEAVFENLSITEAEKETIKPILPSKFGGFLQGFFTGKFEVMTGKRKTIPVITSDYWSTLTKGSGTSKPSEVQKRWDFLFSVYAEKIEKTTEYTTPAYILDAEKIKDKKTNQEKDRALYAEFTAWKLAQAK